MKKIWEEILGHKTLRPAMTGLLSIVFSCMIAAGCGNAAELSNQAAVSVQEATKQQAQREWEKQEISQEAVGENKQQETELYTATETEENADEQEISVLAASDVTLTIADIPVYSGNPYVVIDDNNPWFAETDLVTSSYEFYSELDELGRCGAAYACIGIDLMPTEERGSIGSVKPTGWHTVKYDSVDGNYLYNRCHLIGYQLSGENANTKNLITGTRYLNVDGMLPFENMVADYVKETQNHVMYRVTPIFEENNLLAAGVELEARSVEDGGEGILFHVFCYNVQPGIEISYETGESRQNENNSANLEADVKNTAETTDENAAAFEETTGENAVVLDETIESEKKASSGAAENDEAAAAEDTNPSGASGAGGSSATAVWKSATGSKYHSRNNCGNMNSDSAVQLTEEQAVSQGLEKCKKCW